MWVYWVPQNLQLLVKIARFMWISPQLKKKKKESWMTPKESPPNQEPWSPGPYCSPSVGVGGTGWVSHLELQLLGLFQKLQSTASPQHCRVKPQHWLTGSVPWLVASGLPTGSEPLEAAVMSCPFYPQDRVSHWGCDGAPRPAAPPRGYCRGEPHGAGLRHL